MNDSVNASLGLIAMIIAVALNSFLTIVVLFSDSKRNTNRLFACLATATTFWLAANVLSVQPQLIGMSLWLVRLSLCLAVPVNVLFFQLAFSLPRGEERLPRKVVVATWVVSTVVMLLTLLPITVLSVSVGSGRPTPEMGPGILFFGLHAIFLNIVAVIFLVHKLLSSRGPERRQLAIVGGGVVAMFSCIIVTIFIPLALFRSNALVGLFPFYALLFLAPTAYAIIEYRLFNVKVIAATAAAIILVIVLAAKLFVATSFSERVVDVLVLAIVAAFCAVLVRSVRREVAQRIELQKLTKNLQAANVKLEELSEMKSNFISIASHQLRAPIGGVRSYLSMFRDGDFGKFKKKVNDVLDLNLETLGHLLQVIETFLNVTRFESGKISITEEQVDLCEIAQGVYKELQMVADRKKITFTLACAKQSFMITGDREKLRNVLFNYVENALKYTESGSITTTVVQKGSDLEVRVTDTGIGIDPAEIPNLFAKFVRAGGGFKIAHGSGLGLYVAKMLTEAHGGSIFVESPGVGKGSTFGFRIPLRKGKSTKKS